MQTPEQIRERLKNEIDNLMSGESFSVILTVNKRDGLVITSAAIGLEPDFKEVGKSLYRMMEQDGDCAEKMTAIMKGMDEMLDDEEHSPMLLIRPSKTQS